MDIENKTQIIQKVLRMNAYQKKRILQKLWGWLCLSINCLIFTLYLANNIPQCPGIIVLLPLLVFNYGLGKTGSDIYKNDLTGISVAIEYIGICITTLVAIIKISSYLLSTSLIILSTIFAFIECLVFLLITYWYRISRFFTRKH